MPESFLSGVAEYLLSNFNGNQQNTCIVFSNRRARIFFHRELLRLNPATQWLPEIYSMEDFVKKTTLSVVCDPLDSLFEFYNVYTHSVRNNPDSFEQFCNWAPQILNDFDEADLHQVQMKEMFGFIDAAYAIKNWNPSSTEISTGQNEYLSFWSGMGHWYEAFREALRKKSTITHAMAFRYLAENIDGLIPDLPWDHIIFAGLNALSRSEQQFIGKLKKAGKATVLWDVDSYYIKNQYNEAGYFFKKFMSVEEKEKILAQKSWIESNPKTIEITGVAKNTGQAALAGDILDRLTTMHEDLSDTAVVLCDESLLIPVLESIPARIEGINITMGYPLYQMPEAGLFELLFELQAHCRSIKSDEGKPEFAWYHRDVIRILRNPVLSNLIHPQASNKLIKLIQDNNFIFIPGSALLDKNDEYPDAFGKLGFLFNPWEGSPINAIHCFQKLISEIRSELQGKDSEGIRLDAIFMISGIINRLEGLIETYQAIKSTRSLQRFFNQLLRQEKFSFTGEPLKGLQIMGLLETRNLDFKNIIMLSVNEGMIPASRGNSSFIPQDIRSHFRMPVYNEREAIYAYHFYRLLQRSSRVWLIYNTETDEFGKGEQSRFISQIMEELPSSDIKITKNIWAPPIELPENPKISIAKTPEVIGLLRKNFDGSGNNYFSPTSISSYLKCSLQFYFRYIRKIWVEKSMDDDIGSDIMGLAIHEVLKDLFTPFIGKRILPGDVSDMIEQVDNRLQREFLKKMNKENLRQGRNLLIFSGSKKLIINYLIQEREYYEELNISNAYVELLTLESELRTEIQIDVEGEELTIPLGGKVDRIDKIAGDLRVIDYKTGSIDPKIFNIEEIEDFIPGSENIKVVQLLHYALMVNQVSAYNKIYPGIISLRKPSLGLIDVKFKSKPGIDANQIFVLKESFSRVIHEIFDKNKKFEQTTDEKHCKWCDFRTICNR